MMSKRLGLTILAVCLLVLAVFLTKPMVHLVATAWSDANELEAPPPGHVNDASRLNLTQVADVWHVPVDNENPEAQLAELLARARTEGRRVSIAGARHSMGGHTIYPDGIAINMLPWDGMTFDPDRDILKVQAGAVWKDVIAYLDQRGCSVDVMQSNNSFTVGGSISVNCHGWPYDRPPIASTVESFRLMQADGSVVRCSRTENAELFCLVPGGYGLFGIILDAELRVTNNERYRLKQQVARVNTALDLVNAMALDSPTPQMAYVRISVAPDNFMEEAVINAFMPDPHGEIPELTGPRMNQLRRTIFRGSAENAYGKELRWIAETKLQPWLRGEIFSRNQLLNEGVEVFANRSADSTDILHEYFVPRRRGAEFVAAMRTIIPQHPTNLLNITVRTLDEDRDTFLRYADQPMTAFVLLFLQERSLSGERSMQILTRELIDAAIEAGGRYYLPYRLHATRKQFDRAYPQAREFFDLKRKYDPDELFQNQFYVEYGRSPEAAETAPPDDGA